MYDFSLINIVMNNGVKYSIVSSLEPSQVIIYIKEHTEDGFEIVDEDFFEQPLITYIGNSQWGLAGGQP